MDEAQPQRSTTRKLCLMYWISLADRRWSENGLRSWPQKAATHIYGGPPKNVRTPPPAAPQPMLMMIRRRARKGPTDFLAKFRLRGLYLPGQGQIFANSPQSSLASADWLRPRPRWWWWGWRETISSTKAWDWAVVSTPNNYNGLARFDIIWWNAKCEMKWPWAGNEEVSNGNGHVMMTEIEKSANGIYRCGCRYYWPVLIVCKWNREIITFTMDLYL